VNQQPCTQSNPPLEAAAPRPARAPRLIGKTVTRETPQYRSGVAAKDFSTDPDLLGLFQRSERVSAKRVPFQFSPREYFLCHVCE
jgi:hypothetical protein